MAAKHCHACKHNGKGDKACLTCKTNPASPLRSSKSIDPVNPRIAAPIQQELSERNVAEFFREWLFLPPRLRDVFVALYLNHFVLAEAARKLQISIHQVSYARDALKKHTYFTRFFVE